MHQHRKKNVDFIIVKVAMIILLGRHMVSAVYFDLTFGGCSL